MGEWNGEWDAAAAAEPSTLPLSFPSFFSPTSRRRISGATLSFVYLATRFSLLRRTDSPTVQLCSHGYLVNPGPRNLTKSHDSLKRTEKFQRKAGRADSALPTLPVEKTSGLP